MCKQAIYEYLVSKQSRVDRSIVVAALVDSLATYFTPALKLI